MSQYSYSCTWVELNHSAPKMAACRERDRRPRLIGWSMRITLDVTLHHYAWPRHSVYSLARHTPPKGEEVRPMIQLSYIILWLSDKILVITRALIRSWGVLRCPCRTSSGYGVRDYSVYVHYALRFLDIRKNRVIMAKNAESSELRLLHNHRMSMSSVMLCTHTDQRRAPQWSN